MWCAYVFAALALVSLPAAIISGSPIIIVGWIAQTFLQLVLLPVIIVGQNIQAAASDDRAARDLQGRRRDPRGGQADPAASGRSGCRDQRSARPHPGDREEGRGPSARRRALEQERQQLRAAARRVAVERSRTVSFAARSGLQPRGWPTG